MRLHNILYLGAACGTSQQRADALRRLGHEVCHIDPHAFLPCKGIAGRVVGKLIYSIGAQLLESYVRNKLSNLLRRDITFDVAWVDSGALLGATILHLLHSCSRKVLNYNHDDPFGDRDGCRFSLYRDAVADYDLLTVVRRQNVEEAMKAGARQVLHVFRAADEVAHAPLNLMEQDQIKWSGDVVFVGTWMPERGPFLARLMELGVPLTIYGDRWHKAREWMALKKVWAGPNLTGSDYVKAIQCAKISLGLLSKGNRDLHTTRSAEIPYIGSVLCAERTSEHEALYRENEEAVFWSTPEECAEKCFWLLARPDLRKRIAKAGRERCIANGMLNEVVAKKILQAVLE